MQPLKPRTRRIDYPSKQITIDLNSVQRIISNKEFKEALQTVPHVRFHNLLQLKLTYIKYTGIQCLIGLIARLKPDLEGLGLDFTCTQLERDRESHRILPLIIDLTKQLSKLRILDLSFANYHMLNEQWLETIASRGIRNWTYLQHLSLDFTLCSTNLPIPTATVRAPTVMGRPSPLKDLFRNMEKEAAFNSAFELLVKNISRFLRGLKVLKLCFKDCKKLEISGPQKKALQMLQRLTRLEKLSLDFSICPKINDETLEFLGLQMPNLWANLNKLALNFSSCTKITDAGIEALISGISKNPERLKSLTFDFTSCTQITDEGIEVFVGYIAGNLSGLQTLVLRFYRQRDISSLSVEALLKAVAKGLIGLKEFTLHAGCNKRCEDEFQGLVRGIPRVTIT